MAFTVITNPSFKAQTGFTQAQFKKLDDLYCRSASLKILTYRTVECDFEEGVARYTYYQSDQHAPALQFIISKAGPRDLIYEVYQQGRGRIARSGVFERAFEVLRQAVENPNS